MEWTTVPQPCAKKSGAHLAGESPAMEAEVSRTMYRVLQLRR